VKRSPQNQRFRGEKRTETPKPEACKSFLKFSRPATNLGQPKNDAKSGVTGQRGGGVLPFKGEKKGQSAPPTFSGRKAQKKPHKTKQRGGGGVVGGLGDEENLKKVAWGQGKRGGRRMGR